MCGILGEVSKNLLNAPDFKRLLDYSKHRGPDAQSVWRDDSCQLGFNRLAILDTSEAAMQPVQSPSGRYVLVFNGEIYNYKDLQQQFDIPDSALRSHSDSEVLVQLLDKLPFAEVLDQLNGMFALAVWDTTTRQLYLARDFSGIKPLYYGFFGNGVVFASQFDQVFKHSGFSNLNLRPDIMKEFFGLGYMQAPNTVFKDIFQVEPGQYIIWDYLTRSVVSKKTFYHWALNPQLPDDSKQTLEQFSTCFNATIHRQLRSDVPIASFLSSGYDSSLVTAYAKQHKADIKAFTFGIQDSEMDESEAARRYTEFLDVSHIIEKVSESDILSVIDSHFQYLSEPFGDYSSIPTFIITQRAKLHATVMLSGDGGDELFWGYPRFRKSLNQAHWFKVPLWLRKVTLPVVRQFIPGLSGALDNIAHYSTWILNKQIHLTGLNTLMPQIDFSEELKQLYCEPKSLDKPNVLQYLKRNEYYGHMQRTLKKVDLMSMANSLEVRVPFLDKELIGFSHRIRPQFTISHDRPKLLLKDDLYRFIPLDAVSKTKKGFTVPIQRWLNEDLKVDFVKTVLETPFFGAEYLDMSYLQAMITDFYDGSRKVDAWGLWHVYVWQKWAINHKLI